MRPRICSVVGGAVSNETTVVWQYGAYTARMPSASDSVAIRISTAIDLAYNSDSLRSTANLTRRFFLHSLAAPVQKSALRIAPIECASMRRSDFRTKSAFVYN